LASIEKPKQLREKHPKLYEELRKFYKQDPAAWPSEIGDRQ
jgi:Mlc titration factor MtfA (ptsG expression regulator)